MGGVRGLPAVIVAGVLTMGVGSAAGEPPAGAAMKGGDALAKLVAGNAKFVADASDAQPINAARRAVLAKGQAPYAIILSCADSRVPPEIIFNAGLGDLFVVRVAGEVVDRAVLASVEYAAEHLHAPLLVVLGHESCGAVKSAIEATGSAGPNLDYLLGAIKPAIASVDKQAEKDHLRAAIFANIEQVVNESLAKSTTLSHLLTEQKLVVVGAYYELESGRVVFSQPITSAKAGH